MQIKIEQILKNRAWKDVFEERAAIMEFDGGLSREEADEKAKEIVLELFQRLTTLYKKPA